MCPTIHVFSSCSFFPYFTLNADSLTPPAPGCCGVKKKFNIRMQSSRFLFSLFLLSIFTVCHHHQREIFLLLLIFLSFTNLFLHTVVVIRCKEMHKETGSNCSSNMLQEGSKEQNKDKQIWDSSSRVRQGRRKKGRAVIGIWMLRRRR